MPSTDAYRVLPYNFHAWNAVSKEDGYPVHFFYPLDSGHGEGSYRVAGFAAESEARHFTDYCNRQLEKHNTNDMSQWDWA